jgi:hypothetical protein
MVPLTSLSSATAMTSAQSSQGASSIAAGHPSVERLPRVPVLGIPLVLSSSGGDAGTVAQDQCRHNATGPAAAPAPPLDPHARGGMLRKYVDM